MMAVGNLIQTGSEYVEAITTRRSDRRTRSAFQALVVSTATPGATLLDFGSGPGIDARFYAERGFRVVAYDVDPAMRDYFASHCRDFMLSGRITLQSGTYPEFLALPADRVPPADVVTSNFAPLNLIEDVAGLFAKFHVLTGPRGKVLASVLSPYFIGDARYRWWWRNISQLRRDGRSLVPGIQAPIVRRTLGDFAAQSAPFFRLTQVFSGLGRSGWLRLTGSRFMFLLFEKQ
jgi:SAM-dependent methyltransferase